MECLVVVREAFGANVFNALYDPYVLPFINQATYWDWKVVGGSNEEVSIVR